MTWEEKENLREDICLSRELMKWLIDKGTPRKECLRKLEKHKRRIRQEMKNIYERDKEKEIVVKCDEDGTGWIVKEWYDSPFSKEEKEEYIKNNWHHIHSMFDCTGLVFTRWICIFNIETSFGARAVVYHAKGLDV